MSRTGSFTATATLLVVTLGAAACTSTDHVVANRPDLLQDPRQTETLGEAIQRAQREGCLRPGGNRDLGCTRRLEEWAEVIAPPPPPELDRP